MYTFISIYLFFDFGKISKIYFSAICECGKCWPADNWSTDIYIAHKKGDV